MFLPGREVERILREMHADPETYPTKVCPRCGEEKFYNAYGNDATRKDGCYPYCRECQRTSVNEEAVPMYDKQEAPFKHTLRSTSKDLPGDVVIAMDFIEKYLSEIVGLGWKDVTSLLFQQEWDNLRQVIRDGSP
jgi:hypothetical protein